MPSLRSSPEWTAPYKGMTGRCGPCLNLRSGSPAHARFDGSWGSSLGAKRISSTRASGNVGHVEFGPASVGRVDFASREMERLQRPRTHDA
jgi:hypothetical protein